MELKFTVIQSSLEKIQHFFWIIMNAFIFFQNFFELLCDLWKLNSEKKQRI